MLCKNCGLRPATTHIKRVINGKTEEFHLCAECAQKLNVGSFNPFDLSELWGAFFGDRLPNEPSLGQKRCRRCGSSFSEIAQSGKLGCPDCYTEFYDELLPSLRKMHGKTRHVGKVPHSADDSVKSSYKITDLKKQLDSAIESENYEKAAALRDEIHALEDQMKSSEQAADKKEEQGNE